MLGVLKFLVKWLQLNAERELEMIPYASLRTPYDWFTNLATYRKMLPVTCLSFQVSLAVGV